MLNLMILMAPNATTTQGQGSTNALAALLPFILIFFVMWFFIIRPQSKKQKELQKMLDNVKVNDWVLTNGGIIGRVTALKPEKNVVVLEIDDNNHVRVEFQKSAIVALLNKNESTPASAS